GLAVTRPSDGSARPGILMTGSAIAEEDVAQVRRPVILPIEAGAAGGAPARVEAPQCMNSRRGDPVSIWIQLTLFPECRSVLCQVGGSAPTCVAGGVMGLPTWFWLGRVRLGGARGGRSHGAGLV